jgi:CheY-like chemotaxis protein
MTSLLFVDDDDDLRDIITLCCESLGLKIAAVTSGEEALELLSRRSFDVIAADLNLPGISGLELYHALGDKDLMTRFILMTGSEDQIHDTKAFDLAIDHILLKPFTASRFGSLVKEIIRSEERYFLNQSQLIMT